MGDLGRQALIFNNMGVLAKDRSSGWRRAGCTAATQLLFETITVTPAMRALVKYNVAEILSDQGHWTSPSGCSGTPSGCGARRAPTPTSPRRGANSARRIGRRGDIDTALGSAGRGAGRPRSATTCRARSSRPTRERPRCWSSAGAAPRRSPWPNDAFARVDATEGGSIVVPALHRVLGWVRLAARRADRIPRVVHGRPRPGDRPRRRVSGGAGTRRVDRPRRAGAHRRLGPPARTPGDHPAPGDRVPPRDPERRVAGRDLVRRGDRPPDMTTRAPKRPRVDRSKGFRPRRSPSGELAVPRPRLADDDRQVTRLVVRAVLKSCVVQAEGGLQHAGRPSFEARDAGVPRHRAVTAAQSGTQPQ